MGYPIKKNTPCTIYISGLISRVTGQLQVNPTITADDCRFVLDNGAELPFNTTPDVYPAGGTRVRVQLLAAENNGSSLTIRLKDVVGDEWDDVAYTYDISENQIDDLETHLDTIEGKADVIDANLDAAGTLLATVDGKADALSADVAAVDEKVSALDVPTIEEIDDQLSTAHGSGDWAEEETGGGSVAWPITIEDEDGPRSDVDVWISTDEDGAFIIRRGRTNDNGIVTFWLDPGTYFAWWNPPDGYTAVCPQEITVTP